MIPGFEQKSKYSGDADASLTLTQLATPSLDTNPAPHPHCGRDPASLQ
jgi:hypothetical protein